MKTISNALEILRENCEEWRHWQSKQLLLDSKKGQLYQIEDKKLRMQKEKEIDRMWHELMERLSHEKEYQEIYENKLLKVIEEANQLKNQEINRSSKKQEKLECQQSKKEDHEELVGIFLILVLNLKFYSFLVAIKTLYLWKKNVVEMINVGSS